jgi:hypothetical protein
LLISCAIPAGEPPDRAETLGVEQLALELAHARLLLRLRLDIAPPARLVDWRSLPARRRFDMAARFRTSVLR